MAQIYVCRGCRLALLLCLSAAPALAQSAPLPPVDAARGGAASGATGNVAGPWDKDPALPRVDLRTALDRALLRSPSIELARQEISRSEGLLRQVRAGMLPILGAGATYTRLDDDRRSNLQLVLARNQLAASVELSVPLVVPKQWVLTGQAADRVELAKHDAAAERQEITRAVGQAYLAVMAQHRVVDVNARALANARAHYDYAHMRFTGGIGNQIDDVRAAQELETSVATLEGARALLVRAQEALGVLLGEDAPVDVVDQFRLDPAPPLAQSLADAETQRADVRARRARMEAAKRVKDDSFTDYLPFLVAEFRPFFSEPPTVSLPHTGWQAQLVLSVPLYDGGARYGAHDQRVAELAQSRIQLEAALRQARSEVRLAFSTAERADAALAAATKAAELGRQGLSMAMLAYQAGATTNIEVLDAERTARDAETRAVVAEDAARQARLDLLVASGRWP